MTAVNRPTERDFSPADLELLEALANQAASAIQTTQLWSTVERLAITDELTAIYNRRGLPDAGGARSTAGGAHGAGTELYSV